MAAPMEFKVKKGQIVDIDTQLAEFQKEVATSRFPWFYDWLQNINKAFYTAHHPDAPAPTKLKMKILGDLSFLRARELREQFCYDQVEHFYLSDKPPITPKKLDDVITSIFHNRDYFEYLTADARQLWEKVRKTAVDAENLLRNALNPDLEIQDYALKYAQMNSSLALYLWTRRELNLGNLEEVRKQHEGTVEKKLEILKRYSIAGAAAMMSEAFAGEPMPPPFKKIIPEAPKEATPEEKEEIEKERVKVLAEKAAVEAKAKSLTEQRQPLDALFTDAMLLRFFTGAELKNAMNDFQSDPESKVGIKDPANLLAVIMVGAGSDKLSSAMLSQPETLTRVNEVATYLIDKIANDQKLLPETEVTPFVKRAVDDLVKEARESLSQFGAAVKMKTTAA